MKLSLRYYGNPILRKKALAVQKIDSEVVELAHAMVEAMIHFNGVGLAAPQIGRLLRLYVFRDEWLNSEGHYQLGDPQVVINPVLSHPSNEMEVMLEGCLSLPNVHVKVSRPKKIHIRYQNIHGDVVEKDLVDFSARVNMHENDHLNGVLHIDRISLKDRKMVEPVLQKIKKKHS